MELRDEEYPFLVTEVLESLLPDPAVSALLRADQHRRWLVVAEAGLEPLLERLEAVAQDGARSEDPAVAARAEHLVMQIELARLYHRHGLRPGRHAPWGIPRSVRPGCKVHAALLRRSTAEPYRLVTDHALCKPFMKSVPVLRAGEEINCGYCLRLMAGRRPTAPWKGVPW